MRLRYEGFDKQFQRKCNYRPHTHAFSFPPPLEACLLLQAICPREDQHPPIPRLHKLRGLINSPRLCSDYHIKTSYYNLAGGRHGSRQCSHPMHSPSDRARPGTTWPRTRLCPPAEECVCGGTDLRRNRRGRGCCTVDGLATGRKILVRKARKVGGGSGAGRCQ